MIDRNTLIRLKPLLESAFWPKFEEVLDTEIAAHNLTLQKSDQLPILHRAQGAVSALKLLRELKEQARNTRGPIERTQETDQ